MSVRTWAHKSGAATHDHVSEGAQSPAAARLIAALKTAPRLTNDDATYLANLIESTREDSVADEIPD